jgi:integrase
VIGAQWSEFDLDAAVWIVPAERREHRVPLSSSALQIIKDMAGSPRSKFVFGESDKPLSPRALRKVLARSGVRDAHVGQIC